MSYWSTGNGDDTMVTLWNPADQAQDFVFTLFFAGGHYAFPVHMEGRVTRTFNISEIVNSGIPDAQGNRIPPSVQEGSAELTGSKGESQHILVTMDAGTYNVRKATCAVHCFSCNGAVDFWIGANPWTAAVKKSTQLTFTSQYNTGTQYNLTNIGSWSSSNTNIATMDDGLIGCAAPGTVGANATDTSEPLYWTGCLDLEECPQDEGADAGDTGDCAPVIVSLSSPSGQVNTPLTLTINGTGFAGQPSGDSVSIQDAQSVSITSDSTTAITVTFTFPANTPLGAKSVTVTSNGVNSNSVNYAATCYTPTQFALQSAVPAYSYGALSITFTWKSTSGASTNSDLVGCSIAEKVTYPGTGNYTPDSPPWPANDVFVNPTVVAGAATNGLFVDTHSLVYPAYAQPVFVAPLSAQTFTAYQTYTWGCACSNGGDPQNFTGYANMPIVRGIYYNSEGKYYYYQITETINGEQYSGSPYVIP
jgi:hypothetical protein